MTLASVAIDAIIAVGAPVLCLDTCSVLDILRDPTRNTVRAHEQTAALALVEALEAGTALVGLVAEQVRAEFTANVESVEEEATRNIGKLRDTLAVFEEVAAVFGTGGRADLGHLDGHVTRSRKVADRWMIAATPVPSTDDITVRAFNRVSMARSPARSGKDSMKDCVVIETYLDVVAKLRNAGFVPKIVFASSNTKDYAGETGRRLRTDLAEEFARLEMEYAPNLAAARYSLDL